MQIPDESDSHWVDRLCLRYGFQDKPHLLRDLRDVRRRIADEALADSFLDLVARQAGDTITPSLALTSLDRLVAQSQNPDGLVRDWLSQKDRFAGLLKLLGTTPFVAGLVISHHEAFDEICDADFPAREALIDLAIDRTAGLDSEKAAAVALHRFRGLWTLRIAADDLLRNVDIETTTARISRLADACLEGSLAWSIARRSKSTGLPLNDRGEPCRIAALALGKLGGEELNYSSDVDLFFVYDEEGRTAKSPAIRAGEFFGRVIGDFLKVMSGAGAVPAVHRVDLRLRPEGSQGPIVMTLEQTLDYYDSVGRTWERQALIKLRPCAGDLGLGDAFVRLIEPFIYRRYLNSIEIAEIQAMKRRIENRSRTSGTSLSDVKTGYGGIRDIEFVVQFLQLLNGCTLPSVRQANTIRSMALLKSAGCLTPVEYQTLLRNYEFLRKTEHRLQLEEDRQTHQIPTKPSSRRMMAILMGFPPRNAWESADGPFERFLSQYAKITEENNKVLNRLLHDAFRSDESTLADPVTDLILDPEMPVEMKDRALEPFGLDERQKALEYLACMSREEKAYFSTPRCRHFFAATAPKLLKEVATTPFPDRTLARIDTISRVVPVKGLLWESLNVCPKALESFVRMASEIRLVADLIQSRPKAWEHWYRHVSVGAVATDDRLRFKSPGASESSSERNARLRDYRDDRWMEIASVQALPLTTDQVRSMAHRISEVAVEIVRRLASALWDEAQERWRSNGFAAETPGSWGILALGKLGCDSLLFHSDLDLVFVHETNRDLKSSAEVLAAEATFSDLAGRCVRALGDRGPGFLYRVDTRLRPFGASGALSVSIDRLQDYYGKGDARVWERLALMRARPLFLLGFEDESMRASLRRMTDKGRPEADVIRSEVHRLRELTRKTTDGKSEDLKRCDGGSHAIELLVRMLQLTQDMDADSPTEPDEIAVLSRFREMSILSGEEADTLIDAYGLYRKIDIAVRLFRNRLPEQLRLDPLELPYLHRMIDGSRDSSGTELLSRIEICKVAVHKIFCRYVNDAGR